MWTLILRESLGSVSQTASSGPCSATGRRGDAKGVGNERRVPRTESRLASTKSIDLPLWNPGRAERRKRCDGEFSRQSPLGNPALIRNVIAKVYGGRSFMADEGVHAGL
ncbi:hypothetical protein KM043_016586 [Ampulex compressa]|nr:hypothetical protein KM043_016586 [Ampulex compressa]